MDFSNIVGVISTDLEEVEKEIDYNIKSPVPLVYQISKYLLGSGGKRIRPSVLILSSGACGLDNGRHRITSAAALELIHTASLLHDDVVDDANLRRGRISSNRMWGNKASVLVGDFMLARALELIQSCGDLELIKVVTNAAANLAEGQVLEVMSGLNMMEVSEEVCFGIIENKTASLIESCGKVGAILAGATQELKDTIGVFCFNLGVAFQLVDDALDYSAEEKEIGKEVGHDLYEKKMTLPLVYALRDANRREKSKVMNLLQNDNLTNEDLPIILDVVKKYNGVRKTKNAAKNFANKAKKAILG
ncbi:MAG: polyprenyl synthetase family protein, partial [Deltaproteobacteria bacterium]|nr:polyprenyl synthetase family protein [Deltaproteobacteria bacterium]